MANRAAVLHMGGMGRRYTDAVELPIVLRGQLRERFSLYFRELSLTDPTLTPSSLAEQILADVLSEDLLAERLSSPLH